MAFIAGPVPESFERRVTATAREFERDLRQAWPAVEGAAAARRFSLQEGAQTLVIDIEPLSAIGPSKMARGIKGEGEGE